MINETSYQNSHQKVEDHFESPSFFAYLVLFIAPFQVLFLLPLIVSKISIRIFIVFNRRPIGNALICTGILHWKSKWYCKIVSPSISDSSFKSVTFTFLLVLEYKWKIYAIHMLLFLIVIKPSCTVQSIASGHPHYIIYSPLAKTNM